MVGLASDGYRKMLGTIHSFIRISVRRDQFFKKNVYIHKLRISQGSEKSFLHVGEESTIKINFHKCLWNRVGN